jgi:hypothetical protein
VNLAHEYALTRVNFRGVRADNNDLQTPEELMLAFGAYEELALLAWTLLRKERRPSPA